MQQIDYLISTHDCVFKKMGTKINGIIRKKTLQLICVILVIFNNTKRKFPVA